RISEKKKTNCLSRRLLYFECVILRTHYGSRNFCHVTAYVCARSCSCARLACKLFRIYGYGVVSGVRSRLLTVVSQSPMNEKVLLKKNGKRKQSELATCSPQSDGSMKMKRKKVKKKLCKPSGTDASLSVNSPVTMKKRKVDDFLSAV
ncbi:hypothetical protein Tcan_01340, partial [Toxocara canis]